MKTIVITGPSGSGKTILAKKIYSLFKNSIIIKTDSYYRDDFFIKLLSIFIYDIYDRIISIKTKRIIKIIESIYKKEKTICFCKYNFKSKTSKKFIGKIHYNNSFLILEGIFAHRLNLDYKKTINIICKEKKEICHQRRLKRDKGERGRTKKEINSRFKKGWILYFKHLNRYIKNNKVIYINKNDRISSKKLIARLNNFYK